MQCSPAQDISEKTNKLCGVIGKEPHATIINGIFLSSRSEPVEGPVVSLSALLPPEFWVKHHLPNAPCWPKAPLGLLKKHISQYFRDDEQRENERHGIPQILEVSGSFYK